MSEKKLGVWNGAETFRRIMLETTYDLICGGAGLGTCRVASFDEKAVKKALDIPKEIRVVAMTPLGYPEKAGKSISDKKPIEKIVHHEKW